MQQKGGCLLLIVLYVDDFLVIDGSDVGLRDINSTLSKAFSMIDLGLLRNFTGLEVNKNASGIMFSQ